MANEIKLKFITNPIWSVREEHLESAWRILSSIIILLRSGLQDFFA